eukprot:tig00021038_g17549.t1
MGAAKMRDEDEARGAAPGPRSAGAGAGRERAAVPRLPLPGAAAAPTPLNLAPAPASSATTPGRGTFRLTEPPQTPPHDSADEGGAEGREEEEEEEEEGRGGRPLSKSSSRRALYDSLEELRTARRRSEEIATTPGGTPRAPARAHLRSGAASLASRRWKEGAGRVLLSLAHNSDDARAALTFREALDHIRRDRPFWDPGWQRSGADLALGPDPPPVDPRRSRKEPSPPQKVARKIVDDFGEQWRLAKMEEVLKGRAFKPQKPVGTPLYPSTPRNSVYPFLIAPPGLNLESWVPMSPEEELAELKPTLHRDYYIPLRTIYRFYAKLDSGQARPPAPLRPARPPARPRPAARPRAPLEPGVPPRGPSPSPVSKGQEHRRPGSKRVPPPRPHALRAFPRPTRLPALAPPPTPPPSPPPASLQLDAEDLHSMSKREFDAFVQARAPPGAARPRAQHGSDIREGLATQDCRLIAPRTKGPPGPLALTRPRANLIFLMANKGSLAKAEDENATMAMLETANKLTLGLAQFMQAAVEGSSLGERLALLMERDVLPHARWDDVQEFRRLVKRPLVQARPRPLGLPPEMEGAPKSPRPLRPSPPARGLTLASFGQYCGLDGYAARLHGSHKNSSVSVREFLTMFQVRPAAPRPPPPPRLPPPPPSRHLAPPVLAKALRDLSGAGPPQDLNLLNNRTLTDVDVQHAFATAQADPTIDDDVTEADDFGADAMEELNPAEFEEARPAPPAPPRTAYSSLLPDPP